MKPDDLAREAKKVLEPLRLSPVAVSSEEQARRTRDETLPGLSSMIEQVPQLRARQQRRRLGRRVAGGVGAALALAAAVALVWMQPGAEPERVGRAAHAEQLVLTAGQVMDAGEPLAIGGRYVIEQLGRLSTPEDRGAELVAGPVRFSFAPRSTADLAFGPRSRRIALNRGRVELYVAPLEAGSTLSVATPDAVVTVHGTRFSVEYAGAATCVRVEQGVVSVQRGAARERLRAGQSSGCRAPPAETSEASEREGEPAADAPRPTPRDRDASGTLTRENALFRRALSAEQAGDLPQAESSLKRLLTRYPDSPLAGEASRVLERVHAARGEGSRVSGPPR